MSQSTPEPLQFPPVAGLTVRAEFDGGALSSDFGSLIPRGADPRVGQRPVERGHRRPVAVGPAPSPGRRECGCRDRRAKR
jgi:hypothetical protein